MHCYCITVSFMLVNVANTQICCKLCLSKSFALMQKSLIVWIHRFCLRKFPMCTKPLECWQRKMDYCFVGFVPWKYVCVRVPFCSYIQALANIGDPWNTHNCNQWPFFPLLHLSVFPSSTLSISLSTLLASSPVWVTAALFQFSVHFLLWWTPAVRVHHNWQSTHLCSSCSLSFLIYYYYSSRWSFANYDHNHEINHPQCLFLVKGLCKGHPKN